MAQGKHNRDNNEAASDAPIEYYRSEDYDQHEQPAERPTGEAGPPETVEHRSYDYDDLAGGKALGTVADRASTKVIGPSDASVGAK